MHAQPIYGNARPLIPHGIHQNRHRVPYPYNHQWRPFHGPHGALRPRSQGFYNHGPPSIQGVEEHWCETCDRGFLTLNILEKHKQQHQKCNIDGCQFIAHPKVITKHIQMQHSSGLYKKIAKLNNPEEIEKWKEERRKKYPTKTNIEKKAAELKEKIDRGEKMGLGRKEQQNRRNGNNQHINSRGGQGMKRGYNNNQLETTFRKPRKQAPKRPKILPEPEENRSLPPFPGIQCLVMDSDEETDDNFSKNNLIEDDELAIVDDLGDIESEKAVKPVVCGALSSLMCEYGSSDEEIEVIGKDQNNSNLKNSRYVDKNVTSSQVPKKTIQSKDNQDLLKEAINTKELCIKIVNVGKREEIKNNKTGMRCPNQPSLASINLNIENKNIVTNINDNCKQKEVIVKTGNSNDIHKFDSEIIIPTNINNDPDNEINARKNDDDDSGPEEVKVVKNDDIANYSINNDEDDSRRVVKKKLEVPRKKPVYSKPKPRIPSTLIYRLLSKEMKQERNQVLQCIRYIRKHNYFDKSA